MSSASVNNPELSGFLYAGICSMATDAERRVNATKSVQILAGMFVELAFFYEDPEDCLEAILDNLGHQINITQEFENWSEDKIPPPHITEYQGELGREYARQYFQDWDEDLDDSLDIFMTVAQHCFYVWDNEDLFKDEMFRLFRETVVKIMQFEVSAQELCDLVIETKMLNLGWSLGDTISSLSGAAGRRLALSLEDVTKELMLKPKNKAQESIDYIVYVMTQEAIRQGIPAGTDWRFGMAANDMPPNAPKELVDGADEFCIPFFEIIGMDDLLEQAVACAKAAGRMLAVAAGGELPEIEPAIAKPLAMIAMKETYQSVFQEKSLAT